MTATATKTCNNQLFFGWTKPKRNRAMPEFQKNDVLATIGELRAARHVVSINAGSHELGATASSLPVVT